MYAPTNYHIGQNENARNRISISRMRKKWHFGARYGVLYALRDEMWGERPMRGGDVRSEALFSYLSCEARVPLDHPLRPIQKIVDEALGALTGEFDKLYAKFGRPSLPPEKLLRALLLRSF